MTTERPTSVKQRVLSMDTDEFLAFLFYGLLILLMFIAGVAFIITA
jgi:hypothetical protein